MQFSVLHCLHWWCGWRVYVGSLKSFRPKHKDDNTSIQILGNMSVCTYGSMLINFEHFEAKVVLPDNRMTELMRAFLGKRKKKKNEVSNCH